MKKRVDVGANDQCPCWSGKKYKKCCRGSVDWPAILAADVSQIPHLSARGRNIMFSEAIFDALKLDTEKTPDLATFKRAFTADAVRKIHEAVFELWPPDTDLERVLAKSSGIVAGLFIGDYEGEYLERCVVRHCLYSDKILLVDPFPHPYVIKPEFNPIDNPAQYRVQTLRNVNRFLRFLPWIDAGLVEFIRTADDLDRKLKWHVLQQAEKMADDPEIEVALKATVKDLKARHMDHRARKLLLLGAPDSNLRKMFRELADTAPMGEDEFIAYIQRERDMDPDFLESMNNSGGQLHMFSAVGTIEMAKATAEMAGAYIFTDLKVRWQMLQKDRETLAVDSREWSPFAKAVQDADLSFLGSVDLRIAMALRTEGRLEGVRSVMRDAWKADLSTEEYDERNALRLAENLKDAVREARAEWVDIEAELAKFGVAAIGGGLLASGPLIANGHASWVAGSALAVTAGHSLAKHLKERGFEKRYPASFFMDLDDHD